MDSFFSVGLIITVVVMLAGMACHLVYLSPLASRRLSLGVVAGVFTIFVIQMKMVLTPDRFIDLSPVLMTLAGFAGGGVTVAVATAIAGLYWFLQTGGEAVAGIVIIIVSGIIGSLLRWRFRNPAGWRMRFYFFLGLLLAGLTLAVTGGGQVFPPAADSGAVITLVVALPVAVFLSFKLYYLVREKLDRIFFVRILLKKGPLLAAVLNRNGGVEMVSAKPVPTGRDIKEKIWPLLQGGEIKEPFSKDIVFSSCADRIFSVSVVPVKVKFNDIVAVVMMNDITRDKRLEEEIARLDRLNLVGQMAANIGHEVRNPLTTVRGFLQMLSQKETEPKVQEYYQIMIGELDRTNQLLTEFLLMAKNKSVDRKLWDLNQIIEKLLPLIQANAVAGNINLKVELGTVREIMADEKEIRQIILNLARNAVEAMEKGGGLTIRTEQDGAEVVLSVQDEGPGIAPDILAKLGTPFLTSKEAGTGLGLPVCYSIAERHNAVINVNTGPAGTTFLVRFRPKRNKPD